MWAFSKYLNFSCYTTACVVTCARARASWRQWWKRRRRRGGGFGAHALLRTFQVHMCRAAGTEVGRGEGLRSPPPSLPQILADQLSLFHPGHSPPKGDKSSVSKRRLALSSNLTYDID